MKKFTLGFIIAIILLSAGAVFAKDILVSWYTAGTITTPYQFIEKTFDEDANVVCYTTFQYVPKTSMTTGVGYGAPQSISCIKNN